MRSRPRILWVLAALLWLFFIARAEAQAQETSIVMVDGLGPVLLPGATPGEAARSYAQRIARTRVFPSHSQKFLRWAARVEDPAEVTLASLRAEGKPIIGIQLNKPIDLVGSLRDKAKRVKYALAIREAGGIPVFLPPAGDPAQIDTLLAGIDHLLLVGGYDLHPRLYRQRLLGSLNTNLKRDRYELKVLRRALALGMPVDGICRGFQLINVALGGKMRQETKLLWKRGWRRFVLGDRAHPILPADKPLVPVVHFKKGWKTIRHPILIDPSSDTAKETGKTRAIVPSLHHQAVAKVGRGLKVVARSLDGLPEAVEGFGGRVRGISYHPERSRSKYVRGVFRGMVNRAAKSLRSR